jgi:putative heme-binding domain-containing protein
VGPSLDGLATRLPKEAVLESLLEPSRTIADAYVSHEIELRDGEVLTGRIERETATELFLRTGSGVDALQPVPLASIVQRTRSKVSNMPAGMLDVLEKEEILDLLAYVLAGAEPGRTNR